MKIFSPYLRAAIVAIAAVAAASFTVACSSLPQAGGGAKLTPSEVRVAVLNAEDQFGQYIDIAVADGGLYKQRGEVIACSSSAQGNTGFTACTGVTPRVDGSGFDSSTLFCSHVAGKPGCTRKL